MFLKVTKTPSGNYYSVCDSLPTADKAVRKQRTVLYIGNEEKLLAFLAKLQRAAQDAAAERFRRALEE